jgi:putative peptidoglycan lipid II flippase
MVAFDMTLGLALIWPMAESGLAFSTALSAVLQLVLLVWLFARKYASLGWHDLIATVLRTILASAAMAAVCYFALAWLPSVAFAEKSLKFELLRVGVPVVFGAISYVAVYRLIGGKEISMLWTGVEK